MIEPDDWWKVEDDYLVGYENRVRWGREEALRSKVAIVAIARNCGPILSNTLELVDSLAGRFREAVFYAYENDSEDDTASVLDAFCSARTWAVVEHETLGRPDYRGFQEGRTHALAEYRNRCHDWVRANAPDSQYVCVLDLDPAAGFSVEGVISSVGAFCELAGIERGSLPQPGAMASFSLFKKPDGIAHYDAWAARPLAFWEDRKHICGMAWFSLFWPPVGGPPFPMNSAFGGLCLYKTQAYLSGRYAGGDCEHVMFHREMWRHGWRVWLNPGSRYVAICQSA